MRSAMGGAGQGVLRGHRRSANVHYAKYLGDFEARRADALRAAGLSDLIADCGLHARFAEGR